jgi:unsaturated rhamnogalacturonyl hydrolase
MQITKRKFGFTIFFILILSFPLVFAVPSHFQLSGQNACTRVAEYTMNELDYSIFTDWGKGICIHGLLDAYEVTGDEKYRTFAQCWVDQSIRTQTAEGAFGHGDLAVGDSTAIGLSVLNFYNWTGNPKYLEAAIKHLNYLRSPERIWVDGPPLIGGSSHLANKAELWIDHLYMVIPFWAQMGVTLGNDTYIDEAVNQIQVHLKHLQEPVTKLVGHIWSETEGYLDSNLWGRGVGWATASIARILGIIPNTHSNYSYLLNNVLSMLASLDDFQDSSGLWHTIVNDSTTYLETSCSTLFAYTIAKLYHINQTWIDDGNRTMAIRAFNAVVGKADQWGVVHWCSGGTGANPYGVPRADYAIPWGQGLFLSMYREFEAVNWTGGI